MVTRSSLPQNYQLKEAVTLDAMSSLTGWSTNLATTELDNVNGGIKLTQTTSVGSFSYMRKNNISYDFSDADYVELDVYIPDLFISFGSIGLYLFTSYASKYFEAGITSDKLRVGFNRIKILKSSFSATGGAVWSDPITYLRITIGSQSNTTLNPTAILTNITVMALKKGYKGIPKLLFTFDDGYQTQYDNAYPILEAKGFKATCALVSNTVLGSSSSYMRKYTTDILYNAGWDMCNHTTNHVDLTQQADKGLVEIQTCRDWLKESNYTRSADFLFYPYGNYDDDVINVAKSLGVKAGRLASNGTYSYLGFGFGQDSTNKLPILDMYKLTIIQLGYGGLSVSSIKSYINQAINFGETIILIGHKIIPSGPSTSNDYLISDFQTVVDYVEQTKISVVTISEWYNGLTNPRKQVSRA